MIYNRLITFDFDDTLFKTPLPYEGKEIWEKVTGEEWPHKGWWSKKESLNTEVFNIPMNPPIYKQYLRAISNPKNYVVLATGRIEPLRNQVEEILYSNDLKFDEIHLNPGMDTFDFKRDLFTQLIKKINPELYIMYDDREEHLVRFKEWAEKLPCRTIIVDAKTGDKFETKGVKNLKENIRQIIIQESEKNRLIDYYITKRMKGLEQSTVNHGGWSRINFREKNGRLRAAIYFNRVKQELEVVMSDNLYGEIYDMFSMEGFEDIQNHLIKWFKDNFDGLDDITEIYTFDDEEYIY